MMDDESTISRWRTLLIGVRDYEDPDWIPLHYAVNDVVVPPSPICPQWRGPNVTITSICA